MSDETTVNILARISAIELLLTQLFLLHYEQIDAGDEWVAEQHEKMKRRMTKAASTSPDPAFGDHFSAVTAEVVGELLDDIEGLRSRYRKMRAPD
jgi:hypothetical protein